MVNKIIPPVIDLKYGGKTYLSKKCGGIKYMSIQLNQNKMKEQVIGVIKRSWMYKFLKGSEAVLIIGGLLLGIFLGWFATIPAVAIMAGYALLNFRGLADAPLYEVRDEIKNRVK